MARTVSDATMEKRLVALDKAHDLLEEAIRLIYNESSIPQSERYEYSRMIGHWVEVLDRRAMRTARMREDSSQ